MRRYKYSDLLLYEGKIGNLYTKLKLGYNSTNRISQYFKFLSYIEKFRTSDPERLNNLIKHNKAKYYFSLYYVLEICNIISALENSNHDETFLKRKLIDLAKGTYLLSEENNNNTKARDTTFELSLFSFFHSKGLDINLDDPNPDLRLSSNKFIYNIECKRPFSEKTLEKHIKKAVNQLEKTKTENSVPTIAISLEQIVFGNNGNIDFILDSKDQKTALQRLDMLLLNALQKYNPLLGKIFNNRPYLILYYISCLAGLRVEGIMANATFITGNVFNFEDSMGRSITNDLYGMIPSTVAE